MNKHSPSEVFYETIIKPYAENFQKGYLDALIEVENPYPVFYDELKQVIQDD